MTFLKPYSFPTMFDDIWESSTGELGRIRFPRYSDSFNSILNDVLTHVDKTIESNAVSSFKVKSFVDVINTNDCHETRYSFYVPGLKREELSVELVDKNLKLSIKHDESKPKRTTIVEDTIIYKLDDICDTSDNAVSTSLENGVLTVTFKHKPNQAQNRKLL
jgi:HSP20 family molecular chaperone IbpA